MKISYDQDRPKIIEFTDAGGNSWQLTTETNEINVIFSDPQKDWVAAPILTRCGTLSALAEQMVVAFGALLGKNGNERAYDYVTDAVGMGAYSRKVAGAAILQHNLAESLKALGKWNAGEDDLPSFLGVSVKDGYTFTQH